MTVVMPLQSLLKISGESDAKTNALAGSAQKMPALQEENENRANK